MLEPRRLAARAAAARDGGLLGETVGQTAGYRTRLDAAVSAATRIEVVTEGLLVRRLLGDPGLDGVGLVILDEVHERALAADLALALCLDLQRQLRPELRLLAMSATADGARLSALMDAPVVESAGRMFPVSVEHAKRDLASARDLPGAMASAVRDALAAHAGDILAFLPGMGEIRRTQQALEDCGALVLPLHGDLPPTEQDRALRPADGRRVVLATSIAETSLTVPGVRVVIDGGWRRAPRLDTATGLTRLATRADQPRGGRPARGPGGSGSAGSGDPAVVAGAAPRAGAVRPAGDGGRRAERAGAGLHGVGDRSRRRCRFRMRRQRGRWRRRGLCWRSLGAVAEGALTPLGRAHGALGAHPRLAAMMLHAGSAGEQAPGGRPGGAAGGTGPAARAGRAGGGGAAAGGAGRAAAMPTAVRSARIRQAAAQYRRRLRTTAPALGDPAPLLAAAFPDRIAQRRGGVGLVPAIRWRRRQAAARPTRWPARRCWRSARWSWAVPPASGSPHRSTRRTCRPTRITETVESGFDPVTGTVLSRRRRRLGALILDDRTRAGRPARDRRHAGRA